LACFQLIEILFKSFPAIGWRSWKAMVKFASGQSIKPAIEPNKDTSRFFKFFEVTCRIQMVEYQPTVLVRLCIRLFSH